MARHPWNKGAEASSKTYRKAIRKLVTTLAPDEDVPTRGLPTEDFEESLNLARTASERRALEWYRRGLVRGIAKATDWLLDGKISSSGTDLVFNDPEFEVKVRIKLKGKKWRKKTFTIKPCEVGFKP